MTRLRGGDELAAIGKWFDPASISESPNPTNAVLCELGKYSIAVMHNGELSAIHYSVIEGQLAALFDVQGSCERTFCPCCSWPTLSSGSMRSGTS